MGSLMAGWDSHIPDPRAVKLERNRSLTKEEIDTYWRLKKQKEEEHLRAISAHLYSSSVKVSQGNTIKATERRFERSNSMPLAKIKEKLLETGSDESSLEKLIKKNGWWISSNWAFLNEPPVDGPEGPKYKYAAQFHVANMASSEQQQTQTGIKT